MKKTSKFVTKFFAAINGYSDLKARSEQQALNLSRDARDTIKPVIEQYNGVWMHEKNGEIFEECKPFDPIILPWVGYPNINEQINSKDWITNDIKQKSRYLVDIGFVIRSKKTLNLQSSIVMNRGIQWEWEPGKYRFTLVVYGENFNPKSKQIIINIDEYL